MNTVRLDFLPVQQRDCTFYLAAIPTGELVNMCAGLQASPERSTSLENVGITGDADAKQLVASLSESTFAREVIAAQSDPYEAEDPYQRLLDKTRVRAIARYLQQDETLLPNGIILAVRDEVSVKINGAKLEIVWDPKYQAIPLNIIDGQHRVEGLRMLMMENSSVYSSFTIPVTILLDLPFFAQAELFATINGEQKKVNRSRIYDLLGYKPVADLELKQQAYWGEMAVQRFCHHAVKVLNSSTKSPWHNRVKMRGSGKGIVTQAAFVDHLAAFMISKKERVNMRYIPVLFPYFKDSDLIGLSRTLVVYFLGINEAKPKYWQSDDALSASLFGKTNGIAVMINILHDLICDVGGPEKLTHSYVVDKWSKVDDNLISIPPPGGSKGYQNQVTADVLAAMFGDGADTLIRDKMKTVKERLRASKGLLDA